MNTRRSGCNSGRISDQTRRRCTTSGRSCSLACAVFFEGDPTPGKKAVDDRRRKALAVIALETLGDLRERDVGCLGHERKDCLRERFDAIRAFVAALWSWLDRAGPSPQLMPLDGSRRRDAEAIGRSPPAHACIDRANHTQTKIPIQRLGHGGWPPPPATTLNQNSTTLGIPPDSVRAEFALDDVAVAVILVVDDEPDVRELAAFALTDAGHAVLTAQ